MSSNKSDSPPPLRRWQYDVESILAIRKSPLDASRRECLVKFKLLSHRRSRWKDEEELSKDLNCKQAYRKFKEKVTANKVEVCESTAEATDFINPDYLHVDRVIAARSDEWECSDESDAETEEDRCPRVKELYKQWSGSMVTKYLVKWRGLGYDDSTWERPDIVTCEMPEGGSYLSGLQLLNKFKEMHIAVFSQVNSSAASAKSMVLKTLPKNIEGMSCIEDENCYTADFISKYMLSADESGRVRSLNRLKKKNSGGSGKKPRKNDSEEEMELSSSEDEDSAANRKSLANAKSVASPKSLKKHSYDDCRKMLFKKLQSSSEIIQAETEWLPNNNAIVVPVPSAPVDSCSGMSLRDSQLDGIKWLCKNYWF